ncbi:MAG: nucleoside triphosphate pyrophosphohydrolase [Chitinophagales bacterium]|jgi:XTP/dITP diphosphohydrolase|nr:nucleoside triphosphate pyrophosphohydrolase [Chitinophagales bacterium]
MSNAKSFETLLEIMKRLRAECPWDRKQTHESLIKLTIEEVYELQEAILQKNWSNINEEIGDILLHVVFYGLLSEEAGSGHTSEIIDQLNEKLIRRHPHIYGDIQADTEEEVKQNWEKIKKEEKKDSINYSVLAGVPNSLPSIIKAYRLQEKAAGVHFDFEDASQALDKVKEEFHELMEATKSQSKEKTAEEIGDLMFSLVNFARKNDIDPELALQRTNQKFKVRFEYIERNASKPLSQMSLTEMDVLWNKAKQEYNRDA